MVIRPAQPVAVAPHPLSVAPGGGEAALSVIWVTPVRAPTTTPASALGVGVGVGVGEGLGPEAGEPPQPHATSAASPMARVTKRRKPRFILFPATSLAPSR